MSQAGEIAYPEVVNDTFTEFIAGHPTDGAVGGVYTPVATDSNITAEVNLLLASGANAYKSADLSSSAVQAHNPDALLSNFENRINTFISKVEEIDAEGLWTDFANTASGLVDDIMADVSDEEADLAVFEEQSLHNLAESLNRQNASLMDINAVVGTTMPSGHALLEAKFNTDIARYKSERRTGRNRERAIFVMQSIDEMTKMHALRMNSEGNIINMVDEFTKMKVSFKDNETRQNVDFSSHEYSWKLDSLIKGGSMINAMSGITPVPDRMTPAQQLLSNAFAAAGFGITVGTATGSVGLGIATAAGGFLAAQWAQNA
jgi:hypothetical protein